MSITEEKNMSGKVNIPAANWPNADIASTEKFLVRDFVIAWFAAFEAADKTDK